MSREPSSKLSALLLLLGPFCGFLVAFWLIPFCWGVDFSLQSKEAWASQDEPMQPASTGSFSFDQLLEQKEKKEEYVGLSNYSKVLNDDRFYKAILNTILYMLATVILVLPLAFCLALLIRNSFRLVKPALSITLLLPALTLPAVLGILFHLVFHGKMGVLNQLIIMPLGFDAINWLKDEKFILSALIIQAAWRWFGFIAFFYLCAMETIPKAQYEAARLEAAGWWRTLWTVTLPGVRHVTIFSGIFLGVDTIASFSGSYSLFGGSLTTGDAGLLLVNYIYEYSTTSVGTFPDHPRATAISLLVAPVMALITWGVLHLSKRSESLS